MQITEPSTEQNHKLAIPLMIVATALIAATSLIAKMIGKGVLGEPFHPLVITFGRFAFATIALWSVAAFLRPTFRSIHWRLHLGRTTSGWIGVTLMFTAVAYIPLADATAISFLNPVFAMVFAILLLGERVGRWRWAAAAISLCGAMILLRPGMGVLEMGALIALGSAMVLGFEVVLIKKLAGREAPFQVLLVNNGIGLVIASLAAALVWTTPTWQQWLALAAIGCLMAAAQACYLNAVARADASFVVPFSYTALLFAALYDSLVFGVVPDALSWTGACVIVAGAALLAWREARARKLRA
ncbi:MAG: DMT family transporter [Pseudomonadota bacterium]